MQVEQEEMSRSPPPCRSAPPTRRKPRIGVAIEPARMSCASGTQLTHEAEGLDDADGVFQGRTGDGTRSGRWTSMQYWRGLLAERQRQVRFFPTAGRARGLPHDAVHLADAGTKSASATTEPRRNTPERTPRTNLPDLGLASVRSSGQRRSPSCLAVAAKVGREQEAQERPGWGFGTMDESRSGSSNISGCRGHSRGRIFASLVHFEIGARQLRCGRSSPYAEGENAREPCLTCQSDSSPTPRRSGHVGGRELGGRHRRMPWRSGGGPEARSGSARREDPSITFHAAAPA